ncbi:hypothetical protein JNUCC0626_49615 (plasmid) [Lentzea sp. JNUCC 0626]|uniref:hypothetical protein n=1 Tax=Lentzea sp. JNUCC 0626 TaxID=3367513 RepID=UPI0037484C8A
MFYTTRDLPVVGELMGFLVGLPSDPADWLDAEDVPDGTPYLLSPAFEYDTALNSYFLSPEVVGAPDNTRVNQAGALKRFLDFLWSARSGCSWRDASEADHLAFHHWRRRDEDGPRVAGTTWSQEVSHVNQFYVWAVKNGHVRSNPIPQRQRRALPPGVGWRASSSEMVPATYAYDESGKRIEWLPPASYRRWRDVGLRGYGSDGLPNTRFRGRWASRNATYADLMVRTGMRLTEQSSLTVLEIPTPRGLGGYQRFWLPGRIAKYASARWIYTPEGVVEDLASYAEFDRAEVIDAARAAGRYRDVRRPLVIADLSRPTIVRQVGSADRKRLKLRELTPKERRRLFIETEDGLEPALFWLGEDGMPLTVSAWKSTFATANARCLEHGVMLACHPHLLRHSFAVITLEQLQRGHLADLAELTTAQRGQYTRIFGDPLDWVRRRLGHVSVLTTSIYLHALQELEMETRMALVPDGWDDPRDTPLSQLGDDLHAPLAADEDEVAVAAGGVA